MQAELDQGRLETKYSGPQILARHILMWINSHEFMFQKEYPDRYIYSIYFDTADLDAYEENLSGISHRTKVRYRWYSAHPSRQIERGAIEVKTKRNNIGFKKRFELTHSPYQVGDDWHTIKHKLISNSPAPAHYWLNIFPEPILIGGYHRCYFSSPIHPVRVTLDTHLQVWDQRHSLAPNMRRDSLLLPKFFILECKFPANLRMIVEKAMHNLPSRLIRSSKYVNGVRSIFMY